MVESMTGFAVRSGEAEGHAWTWEARSVNGKGLEPRLRLPDGIEGLEAAVRAALSARFARGNLTVTLKLERRQDAADALADATGIGRALAALALVEAEAARQQLSLRPSSAAELLALRGVMEPAAPRPADEGALRAAILDDLAALLDALAQMRATEGRALREILVAQVARIEALTAEAAVAAEARAPAQAEALKAALARVLDTVDRADPDRVAQELALIAVKSDVTEEIDRLRAHVAAARALLNDTEPVGRRFDFLAQEFNREANTLASKANHAGLTRIALELKAAIDQMREQIQNVE